MLVSGLQLRAWVALAGTAQDTRQALSGNSLTCQKAGSVAMLRACASTPCMVTVRSMAGLSASRLDTSSETLLRLSLHAPQQGSVVGLCGVQTCSSHSAQR